MTIYQCGACKGWHDTTEGVCVKAIGGIATDVAGYWVTPDAMAQHRHDAAVLARVRALVAEYLDGPSEPVDILDRIARSVR